MAFIGRKPTNAPLTSDDIPNGIIGAEDLAAGLSKITFDTTPKTTGFTAVANTGYFCNTTSAGFTVTLPATPSAGDQVQLVDYAGTFDTNSLVISPNGNKIEGATANLALTGEREGATLTYIDSTQGWLATSGINEGTDALSPAPYSVDYLVVAGGGSGGNSNGALNGTAGGGGAGGMKTGTASFQPSTVYTITVGDGGAGKATDGAGNNGSSSSIAGTGLTTISTTGGGGGGRDVNTAGASSGGSGGGGGIAPVTTGGAGVSGEGNNGGNGDTSGTGNAAGGGGGKGATGGNATSTVGGSGGNGSASSITGSSTTYAGGGGASGSPLVTAGSGGTGGGGAGGTDGNDNAVSGTANLGGGGGASSAGGSKTSGAGGKGVVILRIPTASYSGTTTGSPTVTDDGSFKVVKFTGTGSYTA